MATRHLWKACLLTAAFLLAAPVGQADSSNPEDGAETPEADEETPPCTILLIGTEDPIVDPHPECIGSSTQQLFALR